MNPIDQVFDFEELEYHYQVANRTEDVTSKEPEEEDEENDETKDENKEKKEGDETATTNDGVGADASLQTTSSSAAATVPTIDNPYLREAKGPKKIRLEP